MIKEAYEAGVKYAIDNVIQEKTNVGDQQKHIVTTPGITYRADDELVSQSQDDRDDNRRYRAFNKADGGYQETTRDGHQSTPRNRD